MSAKMLSMGRVQYLKGINFPEWNPMIESLIGKGYCLYGLVRAHCSGEKYPFLFAVQLCLGDQEKEPVACLRLRPSDDVHFSETWQSFRVIDPKQPWIKRIRSFFWNI